MEKANTAKTKELVVGPLTAAPGTKTRGYLEVPGTPVKMPVTPINGCGEGKTVVITGGTHGGEYPGVETAIRLSRSLTPQEVSGQIIIVHPVNVPAFQAKLQCIGPYDGKNLNREYPGMAAGTVSQRIAYTISSLLFSQADFYMDLHGGDIHEALTPFVIYSKLGGEAQTQLAIAGSKALGVKYICGSVSANGTFGCAATMGVPGFLCEIGNCGLWSEEEVSRYIAGVTNVLRLLSVLEGPVEENRDAVMVDHMTCGDAEQTGCWYPCVKIEDTVVQGQKIGEIRDYFGEVLGEYFAPCGGVMLYVISSLAINAGDPIYAIG